MLLKQLLKNRLPPSKFQPNHISSINIQSLRVSLIRPLTTTRNVYSNSICGNHRSSSMSLEQNRKLSGQNQNDRNFKILNSSKHQSQISESEKLKYDNLIKSTIQNHLNGTSNSLLTKKSKFTFRSVLITIIISYITSVFIIIIYQYKNYHDEGIKDHNGIKQVRKRSIFIPIWYNFNLFGNLKLSYPYDLKYLDNELYEFIINEIIQQQQKYNKNSNAADEINIKEFLSHLQVNNINYSLLSKVSLNSKMREIFGLPINLKFDTTNTDDFNIGIELKYPSISGVEIEITNDLTNGKDSTNIIPNFNFNWTIKSINFETIKKNTYKYWLNNSLNLNNINQENVEITDPIHEIHDKKKLPTPNSKDYDINFSGECDINNKLINSSPNDMITGKLKYVGVIDLNHLILNNGVKIIKIELIYNDILYKIL
ncbi:hypothetical protein KGF54_002231 [Candida jiufengensis]|uniref:uncharacterized protein n=1 Tax=Candida jiufengensis TaxID=497108 RepID=UPI002223F528|nr:uncharacterized protein KGF54_002231 [Candida jiufengensis]KAI5954456.1 hypothetical protein KGF54_002231 [Candida jiufengensis]